jgi:hypothetical protein
MATPVERQPMIAPRALLLNPGEAFIWDIQWKGITVARAEMFVDEAEVRSRLATGALASSIAHVKHELVTQLDRANARPRGGEEILVEDDDTRSAPIPNGKLGHSIHTTLGALRAWADPDAKPGYLQVLHLGELYRVDVEQPFVEELQGTPTLKVIGHVRMKEPATITIWFTADPGRIPMRFEISRDGSKVVAALVDA